MQNKHHKASKLHIKRGDTVQVLSGNNKSKQGKILRIFPGAYRAIVEGINLVSRHLKPSAKNPQGKIEKKEAPIHVSNLMVVEAATGNATRIGRRKNEEGKLERYSKKTGKVINND